MKTVLELDFSVTGLLRFISHLELLHCFSRLAARAGLPVYFTQGFNPRLRISLPVPRTVGAAAVNDRARIELSSAANPEWAIERIRTIAPDELDIHRAWLTESNRLARPTAIEWRIDLESRDLESAARRVDESLGGPMVMTRHLKKMNRDYTADLRPLVLELAARESGVWAKIAYSPQGTVRPGELLQILGLPKAEYLVKMTRIKIFWN